VVFLGPTLPRQEAEKICPADYQPPAHKGDFYRYLGTRTRTLVLIDGLFHFQPSVWHREILAALAEGIRVLGASSMGALRAAELHPFGMQGHGTIFEWYRDGVIDGDDEVALLHGDADSGYRALSLPLVNVRYNLRRAASAGMVQPDEQAALLELLKNRYYAERSVSALLEGIARVGVPADRADRLRRLFREEAVDLKRQDAVSVLQLCAAATTGPAADDSNQGSSPLRTLERLEREEIIHRRFRVRGELMTGELAIERARSVRDEAVEREIRVKWFLSDWARLKDERTPPADEATYASAWVQRHVGGPLDEWLAAASLTPSEFRSLISELALVEWLRRTGAARFGVAAEAVDQAYLAEWARLNGVKLPGGAQDLLDRGPKGLGYNWNGELRMIREFQLTGRLDELG
jgi:hypothetical protein